LPINVPSAERTSASPSVPARAGEAKTSRTAATPSPRRSIEARMLLTNEKKLQKGLERAIHTFGELTPPLSAPS
jgi:hypothetical protein